MNEIIPDEIWEELGGLRACMVKALRLGADVAGVLTRGERRFTAAAWEVLAGDDELPDHPDIPPAELATLRQKVRLLFASLQKLIDAEWPRQVEGARTHLPPFLFDALDTTPPTPADLL